MAEPINTGILPSRQRMRDDRRPVEPGISRRRALICALTAGAAGVLAACTVSGSTSRGRADLHPLPLRVGKAQIARVLA